MKYALALCNIPCLTPALLIWILGPAIISETPRPSPWETTAQEVILGGGAHIKYLAGWEKLFFQSVLVIEKWFNKEMIITKNDTKVEIFVLQIAIKSHSRSSPAGIMVCLWHVLLCLVHRTMCLNTWSTDSDTVLGGCGSLLVHVSWLMNKSHSGIASADSPALVVKMRVAWSP